MVLGLGGSPYSLRKPLIHLSVEFGTQARNCAHNCIGSRAGWPPSLTLRRRTMNEILRRLWSEEEAQDIAEYAVMLAVILVIVVGTIRLIGSNANNVFSSVASSIQ